MKINEVEALVGITRKNIRFYEAEGLLSPRRNSQNGYRDYGETEVEVLRRIKLLRKLGLPLEEIRQMQHGAYTVGDGMRRHLVSLERERQNLEAAIRFCGTLTDRRERLEELDAQSLLDRMAQMEQEGTTFMNKQKQDTRRRRYVAPVRGRHRHVSPDGGADLALPLGLRRGPGRCAAPAGAGAAGGHPGGGGARGGHGPGPAAPGDSSGERKTMRETY